MYDVCKLVCEAGELLTCQISNILISLTHQLMVCSIAIIRITHWRTCDIFWWAVLLWAICNVAHLIILQQPKNLSYTDVSIFISSVCDIFMLLLSQLQRDTFLFHTYHLRPIRISFIPTLPIIFFGYSKYTISLFAKNLHPCIILQMYHLL